MFDFPPPEPSLRVEIASTGMSKGLAQTDGPQLEVTGELAFGNLLIEGYGKNLETNGDEGIERGIFAGIGGELSGFELSGGIGLKQLVAIRTSDESALEMRAEAARTLGPLRATVEVTFSPDDTGATRQSLFVEGKLAWQLRRTTRVSAEIGRREREGSPRYTALNAGVTQQLGDQLTLDVRYYDTDKGELGRAYQGRWVASLRTTF